MQKNIIVVFNMSGWLKLVIYPESTFLSRAEAAAIQKSIKIRVPVKHNSTGAFNI
jgi:hypothetical protein